MLHILWGILKIIFILIGILMGLAVLLLLLILFCPIRYRMDGTFREGEAVGKAGVSWLFHLIFVSIIYEERKLSCRIRILGIPLERYKGIIAKLKKRNKKNQKEEMHGSQREEDFQQEKEEQRLTEKMEGLPEAGKIEKQEQEEPDLRNVWGKIKVVFVRTGRLFCRIFMVILRTILWIWYIPVRIYHGICKIALTISGICGNIEKWKAFLENERVRAALGLALEKGKRLWKHIFPTKMEGWILFGFEDPSVTGQILAVAGMTCPIHKNRIELRPVFDKKIFETDVKLRGRIRLVVILKEGLELYFDKNVKYMIKAWKKED